MEFEAIKTADWDYHKVININTLEELMKLVNDNGAITIESGNSTHHFHPLIQIYDDWREKGIL